MTDSPTTWIVLGGFTDGDADGAPSGLAVHAADAAGDEPVDVLALENPTWITPAPRGPLLYVSHSARRTLSAVRLDAEGTLQLVDEIDIGAMNPAHVAVGPDGRSLIASCFTEGAVVRVALDEQGAFAGIDRTWPLAGAAPGATHRNALQSDAEPHQATLLDDGSLLVPDRAQDVVHRIAADGRHEIAAVLRPGSGPRHLVLHPTAPVAYLVCELDASLVTLRRSGPAGEALEPIDVRTVLPPDWFGESAAAAISLDAGRHRLYVTNRGHDSVAVIDVRDAQAPEVVGWLPVEGATPRFAGVLPMLDVLAVAAMGSHRVDLLDPGNAAEGIRAVRRALVHAAPACAVAVAR
ncbi:lactonase family protein [Agrococcus jenensis]|uniref:lactonase family protein n=1 Tax=Agrococcus jenensis TaxID=46353 RepID=UPI001474DF95|nr:beta-propeller fold lactonase family protein [Agrococcus jenensis]